MIVFLSLYFFFQAEDGIRDGHVTGVQTCALPIYFATSASVLPCNGNSLEFCTTQIITASGPGTSCHSLSHSSEGVSMSLRMRSRVAGSCKRSISLASQPSWAHGGIKAEKQLNHAL